LYGHRPGTLLGGRYKVHDILEGGKGDVYLCYDLQRGDPVVVKTLPAHGVLIPELRAELRAEVHKWLSLGSHPNIVRCLGMELIDDLPHIVLEWVAGEMGYGSNLRSRLQKKRLDAHDAILFAIDICTGLAFVANALPGLLHRDLKPENILVSGNRVAKITDFGMARFARETGTGETRSTVELYEFNRRALALKEHGVSHVVAFKEPCLTIGPAEVFGIEPYSGTPGYQSPEQRKGEKMTVRSDLFSLGCILFEMLHGMVPFELGGSEEIGADDIRTISSKTPGIPESLGRVLCRCLASRAGDRFSSAEELLNVLAEIYLREFGHPPRPLLDTVEASAYERASHALALARVDRADEALPEISRVTETNLENPSYLNVMSAVLYQLGRHLEAAEVLTAAIGLDTSAAFLYGNRATVYETMGRLENAISDCDTALVLDPRLTGALLMRGRLKARSGMLEACVEDLNQYIVAIPNVSSAYCNRADILLTLGRIDAALADYQQAADLDPCSARAHVGCGTICFQAGNLEGALGKFYQAIDAAADWGPAYYCAGATLWLMGQQARAMAYIVRAAELGDREAKESLSGRFCAMAEECRTKGHLERAIEYYTMAIENGASDGACNLRRGFAHYLCGHSEEALRDLDVALKRKPLGGEAHRTRATVYRRSGRLVDALADCDAAIAVEPLSAASHASRGLVNGDRGHYDNALQDFRRALELDPFDGISYRNRGVVHLRRGKQSLALCDFERAAALGDIGAASYARRLRRDMELDELTYPHYASERAWNVFVEAGSREAVELAVVECPDLLRSAFASSVQLMLIEEGKKEARIAIGERLAHLVSIKAGFASKLGHGM
jgi:serine/threonine protein kinase/lipoprotein NlpI